MGALKIDKPCIPPHETLLETILESQTQCEELEHQPFRLYQTVDLHAPWIILQV